MKRLIVGLAIFGFVVGLVVARLAPSSGHAPDPVMQGVAWVLLVVSAVVIWIGMAEPAPSGRLLAACGSMLLVNATAHLLEGKIPVAVLISLQGLGMAAAIVWFVRAYRASKAWRRQSALHQLKP